MRWVISLERHGGCWLSYPLPADDGVSVLPGTLGARVHYGGVKCVKKNGSPHRKPRALSTNIKKHKQSIPSVTVRKKDRVRDRNTGFLKSYTTWRDQSGALARLHGFFTASHTLGETNRLFSK